MDRKIKSCYTVSNVNQRSPKIMLPCVICHSVSYPPQSTRNIFALPCATFFMPPSMYKKKKKSRMSNALSADKKKLKKKHDMKEMDKGTDYDFY